MFSINSQIRILRRLKGEQFFYILTGIDFRRLFWQLKNTARKKSTFAFIQTHTTQCYKIILKF